MTNHRSPIARRTTIGARALLLSPLLVFAACEGGGLEELDASVPLGTDAPYDAQALPDVRLDAPIPAIPDAFVVPDAALLALGVACVTSDDCTSGSCVDGVCCDSTCGGGDTVDLRDGRLRQGLQGLHHPGAEGGQGLEGRAAVIGGCAGGLHLAQVVTGAEGFPAIADAGNVLRPYNAFKLSRRLPPLAKRKWSRARSRLPSSEASQVASMASNS